LSPTVSSNCIGMAQARRVAAGISDVQPNSRQAARRCTVTWRRQPSRVAPSGKRLHRSRRIGSPITALAAATAGKPSRVHPRCDDPFAASCRVATTNSLAQPASIATITHADSPATPEPTTPEPATPACQPASTRSDKSSSPPAHHGPGKFNRNSAGSNSRSRADGTADGRSR
jgi:hypothetical protein